MSREVKISRVLDKYFISPITDLIMNYMKLNLWEYHNSYCDAGYIGSFTNLEEVNNYKKQILSFYWNENTNDLIEGYVGDVLQLTCSDDNGLWIPVHKGEQNKVIDFLKRKRLIYETI